MPVMPGMPEMPGQAPLGTSANPVDKENALPGQFIDHPVVGSEPGKPGLPENVPVITENDIPVKPGPKPADVEKGKPE